MISFGGLRYVRFTSLNLFRWQHWEITSDLLFTNSLSGLSIIANFSFKQRLYFCKVGYCPLISFEGIGTCCFCFKIQYSIDKVVSFLDLIKLMIFCGFHNVSWMSFHIFLCIFFCLYLLLLYFIVAWYKILDFKHNPYIGQRNLL